MQPNPNELVTQPTPLDAEKTTPLDSAAKTPGFLNSELSLVKIQAGLVLADTYQLVRSLGRGGMGEVWLANHLLFDEPRAIKLMLSDPQLQTRYRKRFIQGEARNALKLIHPNIVRIHDLGQYQGLPFIVMEYVAGSDLRNLLKAQHKLSPSQVGELLKQIAAGLNSAHQLGLVHCDLKPDNILLTKEGVPKVSDFGLVKDITNLEDSAGQWGGMGTPLYMSPDQIKGEAGIPSDIYSLGVLLYEMLTGKPPFQGEISALIEQHLTALPIPPHDIEPTISREISNIILKALAKQPEQRYSSVLELAQAYMQALKAENNGAEANLPAVGNVRNLPTIATELIGREQEVSEICRLLYESKNRLVTLTGVGGTGKTRLAIAVAQNLAIYFEAGVYFIGLEIITEQTSLLREIALALGVKELTNANPVEALKAWLAQKQVLLVLDNFEQLTHTAPLLAELLKTAPGLHLLITSRIPLQLSQEREYSVPTLPLPGKDSSNLPLESLYRYAAISLFITRAQLVKPDFQLTSENAQSIIEICRKLDGLPLAVELAAARVRTFPPDKLLSRLDLKLLSGGAKDLPARRQTVRGMIDWSYELLNENEKSLLARLAIFAGGITLDAAETVCGGDEVFEGIDSLCLKNLLRHWKGPDGETRYGMLQTVQEYGLQKLAESGSETMLWQDYASYFVKLAEQIEPKLHGSQEVVALKHLDSEYDNLRNLLYYSPIRGSPATTWRLSIALSRYWQIRGYYSEGQHYLEQSLELLAKASRLSNLAEAELKPVKIKVLQILGAICRLQGNYSVAAEHSRRSLELAEEINDEYLIAQSLKILGIIVRNQGDYTAARHHLKTSLTLFYKFGDRWEIGNSFGSLGMVAAGQGDYTAAQKYYEESLLIRREIGDKIGLGNSLGNLGLLVTNLGDYANAQKYQEESLLIRRETDDTWGIAASLSGLGLVAMRQGYYTTARTYYQESLAIRRKINDQQGTLICFNNLGFVAIQEENFKIALAFFEEALNLAQKLGSKRELGATLAGFVVLSTKNPKYNKLPKQEKVVWLKRTARLAGALAALLTSLKIVLEQPDQDIYNEALHFVGEELGQPAFEITFADGQAFNLEDAIALALQLSWRAA